MYMSSIHSKNNKIANVYIFPLNITVTIINTDWNKLYRYYWVQLAQFDFTFFFYNEGCPRLKLN